LKILFVCNQGKYRSKTAQNLFSDKYETESAGIFSLENPLTKKKLEDAEIVFVMENKQREFIAKNFPKLYLQKKIIVLNIEDIYNYNDSKLKKKIQDLVKDFL